MEEGLDLASPDAALWADLLAATAPPPHPTGSFDLIGSLGYPIDAMDLALLALPDSACLP